MVEPPINIHIHDKLGDKDRARLLKILEKEQTPMQFKTPDITPAQIIGLVAAAVGTATAFGVDLTAVQQHVLIADAGVIGALLFGDSIVRHGRATGNAEKGK
jgi:hypothetical protein